MTTPQTALIKDSIANLYRDGPHPVYLTADGQFAVKWQNKWVIKPALKSIDKLTGKTHRYLLAMDPEATQHFKKVISVKDRYVTTADGQRYKFSWRYWIVADPELAKDLVLLQKRKESAEKGFLRDHQRLMKRAKQISEVTFEELLKKHGVDEKA